ncbi:DUF4276 family protein [Agilicoccus flavus]|uniref:DUF4276 family protein n=1 Tax=Agilicoccus flavus TaxID=2775968 RepID=UPI001CF6BC14|nr:DUF4276 family protein [Agilicoccus flavus]
MSAPVRITSIVEGYGEVAGLPVLLRRLAAELGHYPDVSKPHRIRRTEFVTGAVAKAHRLQRQRAGAGGIVVVLCDADDAEDAESPRNAKKQLEQVMTESYTETIHQPAFSAVMDLEAARSRSRSFRRFCDRLHTALQALPTDERP